MKLEELPGGKYYLTEIDTGSAIVTVRLPKWAADQFDPRTWYDHEGPCFISLSDRVDCCATIDRVDYAWATSPLPSGRPRRWGHTYGSGALVEVAPGITEIQRPDHIYACRRPWGGGAVEWLHRLICEREHGPCPSPRMVADHKRGNTLLCVRDNLHWASPSQNARNIAGSKMRLQFERAA